jgi:hypothetical protein
LIALKRSERVYLSGAHCVSLMLVVWWWCGGGCRGTKWKGLSS